MSSRANLKRPTCCFILRTSSFVLFLGLSTAAAAPPKLNYLFPAGGQRGQTVAVSAGGDISTWPTQIWTDRSGITATAEKDKGKLSLAIASDAIPGTYWLRLTNSDGASQLRAFIVGTLSEIAETESNDTPTKPQVVEAGIVVNGKLSKSGDVDGYRVELSQGQTLIGSLLANSILGSPLDAVLQVCELVERPHAAGKDPQVEAYVLTQNHDTFGLDPQIAFIAPKSGKYLIRLFAFPATPDSTIRFAGGEDYVYRLTLTTGPFLDHVLPLAAPREESEVRLGGWNLGTAKTAIVPSLANNSDALSPPDSPLAWVWKEGAAGAVAIPRVEFATLVVNDAILLARSASEGSDRHESPEDLPLPVTFSGRLESPNQTDSFPFHAAKDQKIRLRAVAKALGFPTDLVIIIQDDTGKLLNEVDDTGRDDRDPQVDFTAPAEGRYRALVRDLHGRGGLRMVYRLTIETIQPDFSLALTADSFVLEKDKPLEIPVNVTVTGGLREPIEIHAIGLPKGVSAEPVKFTPTEDAAQPMSGGGRRGRRSSNQTPNGPSVKLVLKGDPAAFETGGAAIRIEGRVAGSTPLVRSARFPLNLPLAGAHYAIWLTTKK